MTHPSQTPSCLVRSRAATWLVPAAGAFLATLAGASARAQGFTLSSGDFTVTNQSPSTAKPAGATTEAQGQVPGVVVIPEVITIDRSTHTGKARFINLTADTLTADLTLQYAPPYEPPQPPTGKASKADTLQYRADSAKFAADSVKNEALANDWQLNAWLTNFPGQLAFAAHETLTVDFKLNVPRAIKSGEYSAYLIVHTAPAPASAAGATPAAPAPAAGAAPAAGIGGAAGGPPAKTPAQPKRRFRAMGGPDDPRPIVVARLVYRAR